MRASILNGNLASVQEKMLVFSLSRVDDHPSQKNVLVSFLSTSPHHAEKFGSEGIPWKNRVTENGEPRTENDNRKATSNPHSQFSVVRSPLRGCGSAALRTLE